MTKHALAAQWDAAVVPGHKYADKWKLIADDLKTVIGGMWYVPINRPCSLCGLPVDEGYLHQPCADRIFADWIRGLAPRSVLRSSFPDAVPNMNAPTVDSVFGYWAHKRAGAARSQRRKQP
jgi:hypothetical protein